MYRCAKYCDSMQAEWDRLALSRGTVFHTTGFRQVLINSFGYHCGYHVILDEHNRICALIPLIIARNLGFKRAGVSLPFANFVDICADSDAALQFAMDSIAALKERCCLDYLELRLTRQPPLRGGWQQRLDNYSFVLPLAADEETVLALSTAGNRNHVRKVYKNDWFRVSFDPGNLDAFYRVYAKRMKQLGSPAPDNAFLRRFFQYLPENTFLLTVLERATGSVVGGMLLLTSPGDSTVYYPYGANLIEYNSKYLNNFMYWEAVRFGIRSGMRRLDLGRSPAGSGTYKYKQQWGADAIQLSYLTYDGGAAHSGPPDRKKLKLFVELWKRTPDFITDPIGKQLIKYVLP